MKKNLCIIGNGMAGIKAAEKVKRYCPDMFNITILSEETHDAYNRILLSSLLAGEKSIEDIVTHDHEWYQSNGVNLLRGVTVVDIDLSDQTLITADTKRISFDHVLFATGSSPIKIPVPGSGLPQVITFRDIDDVEKMVAASHELKRAIVIGGGLLGLEAAYGLMQRGMEVTVIHLMDHLMERQLDYQAGKLLEAQLVKKGLRILTAKSTKEILHEKNEKVTGITFADGSSLECDIVVMAVGIRPRIELAKKVGLKVNRGIITNEFMETNLENFWAIGECVEFHEKTFGLVSPLFEMADVFARNLAVKNQSQKRFFSIRDIPVKLKVSGIDLYSQGKVSGDADDDEELVYQDVKLGIYRKIILHQNYVEGVVLLGNTQHSNWYTQLLEDKTDISSLRDQLLFGPVSGIASPEYSIAAMSDDFEICGCNGVSKGTIMEAVANRNLKSFAEVKLFTKACTGCGTCADTVQSLLAGLQEKNGDSNEPEKIGICACTDKSHEDIRNHIQVRKFATISDVMVALDWKTTDGCHRCRPALNYYLLCANPKGYQDDRRSRFVNERVHANIQKDGTYSVVPRMFGGMTSIKELRAIADVAEEFNIPTIKMTGGQRVDLLGVKKEDLPAVWKRLNKAGMVSGHAYGKSVRTVKTCVGSEWCRFGTQDSTSMGIELEKALWGSWTPHKVKLAVSGCPRNCAESTIKDLGVVAVESGWELYVGGNGGAKVRVSDFLCKVSTSQEVMEYTCAFLQLYREEARYLDRTSHWIEKVGLAYVKEQIVSNPDRRRELYARFADSQDENQTDPWQKLPQSQYHSEEFKIGKIEVGL